MAHFAFIVQGNRASQRIKKKGQRKNDLTTKLHLVVFTTFTMHISRRKSPSRYKNYALSCHRKKKKSCNNVAFNIVHCDYHCDREDNPPSNFSRVHKYHSLLPRYKIRYRWRFNISIIENMSRK